MVGVFDLTGSIDIVLDRLVSLAFGVLVVVLLFHICRRYWGTQVALGAALIAILLPTSVMNDASGMLEPLGVSLVLLGVWAWPRKGGFWAGLAFGLATMARAEAWIFSLGLVLAANLRREGWEQPASANRWVRSCDVAVHEGLARQDWKRHLSVVVELPGQCGWQVGSSYQ